VKSFLESRYDGQTLDAAAGNVARGNEIRVRPAGIRESVEVVEEGGGDTKVTKL
jgi:hypothetical protein